MADVDLREDSAHPSTVVTDREYKEVGNVRVLNSATSWPPVRGVRRAGSPSTLCSTGAFFSGAPRVASLYGGSDGPATRCLRSFLVKCVLWLSAWAF